MFYTFNSYRQSRKGRRGKHGIRIKQSLESLPVPYHTSHSDRHRLYCRSGDGERRAGIQASWRCLYQCNVHGSSTAGLLNDLQRRRQHVLNGKTRQSHEISGYRLPRYRSHSCAPHACYSHILPSCCRNEHPAPGTGRLPGSQDGRPDSEGLYRGRLLTASVKARHASADPLHDLLRLLPADAW